MPGAAGIVDEAGREVRAERVHTEMGELTPDV